ncbi:hypothetical protein IJ674_01695 [bacterium]|nr:hypothetical protein [bacterium]MBR1618590.1 hypothetical protein [bacterium]
MGITVGDIYTRFPQFKGEDMEKLVGSSNFNGRTVVSLSKLASYNGQYAKDLSVFVAEKEGVDYTKLLSGSKREETTKLAGINDDKQDSLASTNKPQNNSIPMGVSVFNIPKPEMG